MNSFQIRERINKNNAEINQGFQPQAFVLNTRIAELIQENKKLREQCNHKFENGVCIYCDYKEGTLI